MSENNNKDKKINEILSGLQSGNDAEIILALNEVKEHGNPVLIPFLIDLAFDVNPNIVQLSTKILYTLNEPGCVPVLIKEAKKQTTENQAFVIAAIWHSSLPTEGYLIDLVDLSLSGNYMLCVECLTVIENMSKEIKDSDVQASLELIQMHYSSQAKEKQSLISELKLVVQNLLIG